MLIMNTYRFLRYDPKLACQFVRIESGKKIAKHFKNMNLVLAIQSQNNQSEVFGGRICSNIGEIQVECDDCTPFGLANCRDIGVGSSDHSLIVNRERVKAGVLKQQGRLQREIFVDLKTSHAYESAKTNSTVRSRANSAA